MIVGCRPEVKEEKNAMLTYTSKNIFHELKNDKRREEAYKLSYDAIQVSKSLIDQTIKDGNGDMKSIFLAIEKKNDREHAKYIATTYHNYGYWIDAIGVMLKIAKNLWDFEKAKYIAATYNNYGYWTDAIGVMVRIWEANKDWDMLKYVANTYSKYGYWTDAIWWMYNISKEDRDKLYYIATHYTKFWYASDAFLSMYNLYQLHPSAERKSILIPLAQKEYKLWIKISKEGDWTPLLPARKNALSAAKTILWK